MDNVFRKRGAIDLVIVDALASTSLASCFLVIGCAVQAVRKIRCPNIHDGRLLITYSIRR